MKQVIAAYTTLAPVYPGYVNVSREEEGGVVITLRGDPTVREGAYICGHASDKGSPGRCTPGDDRCNNYCNLAPQKGPMVDHPAVCVQTLVGETVTVRLSDSEWSAFSESLHRSEQK